MAITVVSNNRGESTEKIAGTTHIFTPSASLSAGNYGILFFVGDNVATSEGDTTEHSVTDSQGHTWVRDREQTEANTAALTGVTCAVFRALLTNGLTTSDTITVTHTASCTAKGAALAEVSVGGGNTLEVDATDAGHGVAQTSYSATVSGLSNIEHLYCGLIAAEDELVGHVTLDTAYTGMAGGTFGSGTAGVNASNVIASAGTLLNTSTGDTFDNTTSTSDKAWILVAYKEVAAGQTVTGVVLSITPALPAGALTHTITGVALSSAPSLPVGAVTTPGAGQQVDGVVLTITPSLPTGALSHSLTGVVLTATPSLPIGTLTHSITGVALTITPTLPAGQVTVPGAQTVTGVVLTITPTLPAGSLSHTLTGVVLTVTPTLPVGKLNHDVTGTVLTVSPTLPIGSIAAPQTVTGVALVVAVSLPIGAVTGGVSTEVFISEGDANATSTYLEGAGAIGAGLES